MSPPHLLTRRKSEKEATRIYWIFESFRTKVAPEPKHVVRQGVQTQLLKPGGIVHESLPSTPKNMLTLFRTHRRALITFVFAGVLATVILAQIGPRLASIYLGAGGPVPGARPVDAAVYQRDYTSKGIDNFVRVGMVKIECPSRLKISGSAYVNLSFKPLNESPAESEEVSAKLVTNDFEVVPTPRAMPENGEYKYQWTWLITPKQSGDRLLTMWVEPDIKLDLDNDSGLTLNASKTQVLAPITVVSDLGLTKTQSSVAQAIGAILGLIGTVTGYSFLKNYFQGNVEPKTKSSGRRSKK